MKFPHKILDIHTGMLIPVALNMGVPLVIKERGKFCINLNMKKLMNYLNTATLEAVQHSNPNRVAF